MNATRRWWHDAVVYQVYLRSFADGNGDGIGDLDGLRRRLDHIAGLGAEAIWLNPCYPSPQRDHGYDVADYFDIGPEYGTLADYDALVAEAHRHGLRIVMDIVPNHCSTDHPWFQAALHAAPGSPERARFWFRDGRGDDHAEPPNNWRAGFGGSGWTRAGDHDPQWYLGTFSPHQPDWNHTNDDVRSLFADVLEFWFDRGADGFRVDAVHPIGKHPDLPDAPPVPADVGPLQIAWENPHTNFRPEGHEVWREWRRHLDDYARRHPGRHPMMVAEAYVPRRPEIVRQYVRPDEFHQAFAFDPLLSPWERTSIERALVDSFDMLQHGAPPAWTLNNHDVQRVVTRLGRADAHLAASWTGNNQEQSTAPVDPQLGTRRARAAISLLAALPGSLYLYQGEELGLPEVLDLPDDRRQDPIFHTTGGASPGRDGCRVPLPWDDDPATSYGFSTPPPGGGPVAAPWLPQPAGWGAYAPSSTGDDPSSMPALYRRLLEARRRHAVPEEHRAEVVELHPDVVAVRRGRLCSLTNVSRHEVALDLGGTPVFTSHAEVAPGDHGGVIPSDTTVWYLDVPT